jgi:hypothetical protein
MSCLNLINWEKEIIRNNQKDLAGQKLNNKENFLINLKWWNRLVFKTRTLVGNLMHSNINKVQV